MSDVPQFSGLKLDNQNIGGTNITSGSLEVKGGINEETVGREVVDYLEDKYPGLGVTEESLDLSKLGEGIVSFVVSPEKKSKKKSEDFPIEEMKSEESVFAQAQSIVKKN